MKLAEKKYCCCPVLLGALDSLGHCSSRERHMAADNTAKPNINTIISSKQDITCKTSYPPSASC